MPLMIEQVAEPIEPPKLKNVTATMSAMMVALRLGITTALLTACER